MSNRRTFLQQILGGSACVMAGGLFSPGRVLGANDRIRIGLIGAGSRGREILRDALGCPGIEAVGVADAYTRCLDQAKPLAPAARTYRDFRKLLEDKTVDAVLIATPQHLHASHFVASIQAGKDVYHEKTMAFNPEHAKRMRKAFQGSGKVVQIGMQMNSGTGMREVQETATPDRMGIVSAIMSHHYRNAPYGGWRRDIPSDCDADHVDWESFQGEAKRRPFDAQRFWNWRFYWDYSGGNVFENMVHRVGFWYQVLGLSIPEAVTMTGGNYRCPDMQVPDTMTVTMNHREKVLFTWNSMFGNAYFGEGHDYLLGSKGTIMHDESDRVIYLSEAQRAAVAGEGALLSAKAQDAQGYQDWTPRHFHNFFDCMRTRKDPICPFDLGFRTAIACQMAVASYRNQRTVRWDPNTDTIV